MNRLLLAASLLLVSCSSASSAADMTPTTITAPATVDHWAFDAVLSTYVDADGWVDYAGLQASDALAPYLEMLAETNPSGLDTSEAIAFWTNVYNAYTLKLVADSYPVSSIKRITPTGIPLTIPFVHSPFQINHVVVGGTTYSLDDVEHKILRKDFNEPRIHFALVCAAASCPPLRREAYTGEKLDAQLHDQGLLFLHHPDKNRVAEPDGDTIYLSRIFQWFRGDFATSKDGLQAFVAPYFEGELREQLTNQAFRVRFMNYDWSLNDQAKKPAEVAGS